MRVVGYDELLQTLPVEDAIEALEGALRSGAIPDSPPRSAVSTEWGEVLVMPAAGAQGAGAKLVTVAPKNPERGLPLVQGVYALFAPQDLRPEAVLDGAALTRVRTAAVSGLATRYMANDEAHRLVIFGAGVQAEGHLEAMAAVRPITGVRVVSPTGQKAELLVARARALGLEAEVGSPGEVSEADIVCTCTTSGSPVFDGSHVKAGCHVNAIGAFTPQTREVDDRLVARARIAVETREAALSEAGDLLIPMERGVISEADILADLAELVAGLPVRSSPEDITLFKSVGVAFEDLIVARAAVARL